MADLGRLSEELHKFAFEIVFAQLKNYLANVSTMEVSTQRKKFDIKKLSAFLCSRDSLEIVVDGEVNMPLEYCTFDVLF